MRTMMTFGILCKDALGSLSLEASCPASPAVTARRATRLTRSPGIPNASPSCCVNVAEHSLAEYERVCVAASEAVRRRFFRSDATHGQAALDGAPTEPTPTIEPTPWLAGS